MKIIGNAYGDSLIFSILRIPKTIGEWSAEHLQKVQTIHPENHNLPKEKSLNDKQLLVGLKSEPLRQTSDGSSDSVNKLIDNINTMISQPIDHSLETELQQRAVIIRVSSIVFKIHTKYYHFHQ